MSLGLRYSKCESLLPCKGYVKMRDFVDPLHDSVNDLEPDLPELPIPSDEVEVRGGTGTLVAETPPIGPPKRSRLPACGPFRRISAREALSLLERMYAA